MTSDRGRNRMACDRRGHGCFVLRAHRESEEVVVGNDLGFGRIFSWILLPIGVSLVLLPDFSGFYSSMETALIAQGCALWRDVGCRKRELRADHAPSGNVARHRGCDRRHAGGGHAGAAASAWARSDAVDDAQRPVDHGRCHGGIDWRGHCLVCGPPERSATRRRDSGIQLSLGLALAVMCGIFSSGISFALDAAKPIARPRRNSGSQSALRGAAQLRPHYGRRRDREFELLLYSPAVLKKLSLRADLSAAWTDAAQNATLAATGGIMWYLQFFFYAWGEANIPEHLCVRELDAAHEHLCVVRRAGWIGAGRMGRGGGKDLCDCCGPACW